TILAGALGSGIAAENPPTAARRQSGAGIKQQDITGEGSASALQGHEKSRRARPAARLTFPTKRKHLFQQDHMSLMRRTT
ncbi:hypothetical protein RZS08_38185, partial [Arthrospira platensis SPKY1]|nr:hypothetical protein [Arthrospira platensis SPKY1]